MFLASCLSVSYILIGVELIAEIIARRFTRKVNMAGVSQGEEGLT
jgi:hypothetical protein